MENDIDLDLDDFCHQLPKVELHAHLNTSYSIKFLKELVRQNGSMDEAVVEKLTVSQEKDMDESFTLFTKVQQLFKTEEAVYALTCSVIKEFAEDNVKYLELRSTPKEIPATGMTRNLYMRTMIRAVRDCEAQGMDITVRLLVSIDRRHGVEVAQITVDLADMLRQQTDGLVLGVDFSGDPKAADATDYIPVLLDAAKKGLKLALHLAEIPAHEETEKVLRAVGGSSCIRIGHGTFLHRYEPGKGHEGSEDIVVKWRIPIEVCLTSNLMTKTVDRAGAHHFQYWRERNHPVIICTDGKGTYCSTLSEEYTKIAKEFNMGRKHLVEYTLSTVDSIFEGDEVKQSIKDVMIAFGTKQGLISA